MPETDSDRADGRFYLDDLAVGHRFSSGSHTIDADEIVAFARQYDP